MRILHVLDHSIPLQSGYTFRTRAIVREQRRRGWETVHVTSAKQGATAAAAETVDGLEFHRTPVASGGLAGAPVLGEVLQMRNLARRLAEVAAATRPDILHAHSPVLNALPALRVGRRLGLPVVYEVRAFWEDAAVSHGTEREGDLRYKATQGLETFALKRADAVTTICEGLRGDIVGRGVPSDRVTVIPNAVDLEEFPPVGPREPELEAKLGLAGCAVIGFLGSFYHYEGLHLLLQALPLMLRQRPDVRLLLVGGGPQDQALRSQAAQLGLEGRAIFTGRVPHGEVQRYYSLVDLLAYPRLKIRLTDLVTPLKPLEAMAQRKISLASDIGGHRELIVDGVNGFLCAPDDPAALAERALEVLALDAKSLQSVQAAGRAFVEHERNWARSVANYAPIYERLQRRR